jgi:hypothetical protein
MIKDTLQSARAWADAGFSIVPILADGSKQPAVSWKAFQITPADRPQIERWFGNGAERGLAVVWGQVSGNGEALDFDAPGWYERFAALCDETGNTELVDRLPLVETPSGGQHLLFRGMEPPPGNQKIAWQLRPIPDDAQWIVKAGRESVRFDGDEFPVALDKDGQKRALSIGIETRGEGGYTLAPGSPPACHPDSLKEGGKTYRFLRGCPATIPILTPEERGILLALAATFNEWIEPEELRDGPRPKKDTATPTEGGLRPGDDYNARGDYESVVERDSWRRMRGGGDKGLWQRPGKDGRGISATSNYGGRGLFHVFSTNAAPFESDTSYSPFAVYALVEHGGDFSAAAKALAEQGYGETSEEWQARQAKARESRDRLPSEEDFEEGKHCSESEQCLEASHSPTASQLPGIMRLVAQNIKEFGIEVCTMGLRFENVPDNAFLPIFRRLYETKNITDCPLNFCFADAYNNLPAAYGSRAAWVRNHFGDGPYQRLRQFASVGGRWPLELRRPGLPWTFYEQGARLSETRKVAMMAQYDRDGKRPQLAAEERQPRKKEGGGFSPEIKNALMALLEIKGDAYVLELLQAGLADDTATPETLSTLFNMEQVQTPEPPDEPEDEPEPEASSETPPHQSRKTATPPDEGSDPLRCSAIRMNTKRLNNFASKKRPPGLPLPDRPLPDRPSMRTESNTYSERFKDL